MKHYFALIEPSYGFTFCYLGKFAGIMEVNDFAKSQFPKTKLISVLNEYQFCAFFASCKVMMKRLQENKLTKLYVS